MVKTCGTAYSKEEEEEEEIYSSP
jgi:hypothetical protein